MRLATATLLGVFCALCYLEGTNAAENAPYHGTASFYGLEACQFNPDPRCPTASGRSLYALADRPYMAAWFGMFGSRWRVCGPAGCAVAELWDRGPNQRLHRLADLSPRVFERVCGPLSLGVCQVSVEPK